MKRLLATLGVILVVIAIGLPLAVGRVAKLEVEAAVADISESVGDLEIAVVEYSQGFLASTGRIEIRLSADALPEDASTDVSADLLESMRLPIDLKVAHGPLLLGSESSGFALADIVARLSLADTLNAAPQVVPEGPWRDTLQEYPPIVFGLRREFSGAYTIRTTAAPLAIDTRLGSESISVTWNGWKGDGDGNVKTGEVDYEIRVEPLRATFAAGLLDTGPIQLAYSGVLVENNAWDRVQESMVLGPLQFRAADSRVKVAFSELRFSGSTESVGSGMTASMGVGLSDLDVAIDDTATTLASAHLDATLLTDAVGLVELQRRIDDINTRMEAAEARMLADPEDASNQQDVLDIIQELVALAGSLMQSVNVETKAKGLSLTGFAPGAAGMPLLSAYDYGEMNLGWSPAEEAGKVNFESLQIIEGLEAGGASVSRIELGMGLNHFPAQALGDVLIDLSTSAAQSSAVPSADVVSLLPPEDAIQLFANAIRPETGRGMQFYLDPVRISFGEAELEGVLRVEGTSMEHQRFVDLLAQAFMEGRSDLAISLLAATAEVEASPNWLRKALELAGAANAGPDVPKDASTDVTAAMANQMLQQLKAQRIIEDTEAGNYRATASFERGELLVNGRPFNLPN